MSYNYNKLRGRIVEKFGTIDKFAQTLDVSRATVSNKLNNKYAFSQDDMLLWGEKLELEPEAFGIYFCSLSSAVHNQVEE